MMCAGMHREVKICIKTISDHLIIAAATDPLDPKVKRDLWGPRGPRVSRDLKVKRDLWG